MNQSTELTAGKKKRFWQVGLGITVGLLAALATSPLWISPVQKSNQVPMHHPGMLAGTQGLVAMLNGQNSPSFSSAGYAGKRPTGLHDQVFAEFIREFNTLIPELPVPGDQSLDIWVVLKDNGCDQAGPCIAFDLSMGERGTTIRLVTSVDDTPKSMAAHAFEHARHSIRYILGLETNPDLPHAHTI